ncbi:MAG: septal ring lytic transglycosylase RlpA family protein [Arenimonas sp.]
MKWFVFAILLVSLTACASKPERKTHEPAASTRRDPSPAQVPDRRENTQRDAEVHDPCAPIYEHDEKHYTAGGLYAPQLSDSAPVSAIDVDKLIEPAPKQEPLARYGNKSPYTVLGKTYYVLDRSKHFEQHGIASWYGQKFNGRKTSSGEIYSICEFTAAHKTLPLPSYVRVTNTRNGKSVVVRVNDRGPFHEGRIIDLSYVAAIRIGLDKTGTAPVHVELLDGSDFKDGGSDEKPRRDDRSRSANGDEVSLQFGSFADKDNAKRLQDRLRDADIDNVELDKADVQGKAVWRVQLRALKYEQLAGIFEKIRQLGLAKPKVISQKL